MRKNLRRTKPAKRSVNLTLGDGPLTGARTAGLNLSALEEETAAAAVARREPGRVQAEIAQACAVHDRYLAAYGSLGEAVRADWE